MHVCRNENIQFRLEVKLTCLLDPFQTRLLVSSSIDIFEGCRPTGNSLLDVDMGTRRSPTARAALIAGPSGTGKSKLVHAVANEAGAVFLDLSPRLTDGKFLGCAKIRK